MQNQDLSDKETDYFRSTCGLLAKNSYAYNVANIPFGVIITPLKEVNEIKKN